MLYGMEWPACSGCLGHLASGLLTHTARIQCYRRMLVS